MAARITRTLSRSNETNLQYSLRNLLLLVLIAALSLAGYLTWDRHRNTWTIDNPGTIGFELLRMDHGQIEGSGEHFIRETFGVLIRNGDKSRYLLWDNRSNPFDLKNGDKIRLAASVKTRYHDAELNGWYAEPEDIIPLD